MEDLACAQFARCMGSGRDVDRHGEGPGHEGGSVSERRVAAVVEAFLRHLRDGGALDVDPWVDRFPELRGELEPLLRIVLRLEAARLALEDRPPRGGR